MLHIETYISLHGTAYFVVKTVSIPFLLPNYTATIWLKTKGLYEKWGCRHKKR